MSITPNNPADFDPAMGSYRDLKPFRYWCQKVLPLVYDDSLSYYEVLCKVVDYLNKAMEDIGVLHNDVDALHTAYQQLQSYVNNYFSTLDVQEEINNKLDVMAEDGTLDALLLPYFNQYKSEINQIVANQNQNISNFENTVNNTMTTQNQNISALEGRMNTFSHLTEGSTTGDAELADIRVSANGVVYSTAGDAVRGQVNSISGDLDNLEDDIAILHTNHVDGTLESGKYINADGVVQSIVGEEHKVESFNITNQTYVYITAGAGWSSCYYSFQNANGDVLQKLNSPANTHNTIEMFKVKIPYGATKLYLYKYDISYRGVDFFDRYEPYNQSQLDELEDNFELTTKQIDELENDTTRIITTHVNGTVQTGKYIDSNGVVQSIEPVEQKVEVYNLNSELFVFITAGAGWGSCYYSFQNDNGDVLAKLNSPQGSYAQIDELKVRIPLGATKLYVSKYNVAYVGVNFFDSYELKNQPQVDELVSFIHDYYEPIGVYEGFKYINHSGIVATTESSSYLVNTLNVSEGETYQLKCVTNFSNSFYSIVNANNEVIVNETSENTSTMQTLSKTIEIPHGATFLYVAGYAQLDYYTKIKVPTIGSPKKWDGKKWCCVGDSLTEVNVRTSRHYFDYVSDATGITVDNMGLSGSGYKRKYDTDGAFYQRISNVPLDSDVITIFGSFNDLGAGYTLGTKSDTGTDTLGGCINTTLDNLFTVFPLANVGIVSPTPWIGMYPLGREGATETRYVQLLEDICKMRGIPFMNLYYDSSLRPWDATYRQLCYSHDDGGGVHPDETGHAIIAPRFEAFLDELLLH